MIRDRLVICIQDNDAKARLLREKDLSLNKAFDVCKSIEVTNKQLKSLQHKSKQSNEELHLHVFKTKVKPRPSNSDKTTRGSNKTWKCKFCGQAKWHSPCKTNF